LGRPRSPGAAPGNTRLEPRSRGSVFSRAPVRVLANPRGATLAQLHVELVAPDRKVWSGEASIVIAKTVEGEIGIMSGHTPVLAVLQSGPVTIRSAAGEDVVAAVHGGFLSVADDVVTILAELCELPEEIDVAEAEAELQR